MPTNYTPNCTGYSVCQCKLTNSCTSQQLSDCESQCDLQCGACQQNCTVNVCPQDGYGPNCQACISSCTSSAACGSSCTDCYLSVLSTGCHYCQVAARFYPFSSTYTVGSFSHEVNPATGHTSGAGWKAVSPLPNVVWDSSNGQLGGFITKMSVLYNSGTNANIFSVQAQYYSNSSKVKGYYSGSYYNPPSNFSPSTYVMNPHPLQELGWINNGDYECSFCSSV